MRSIPFCLGKPRRVVHSYFIFSSMLQANFIDSTVPADTVFEEEVKKLQAERFKPMLVLQVPIECPRSKRLLPSCSLTGVVLFLVDEVNFLLRVLPCYCQMKFTYFLFKYSIEDLFVIKVLPCYCNSIKEVTYFLLKYYLVTAIRSVS